MVALAEYQCQLTGGAVLIGAGTQYKIDSIEGLERSTRAADFDRVVADGSQIAPDYLEPKEVMITLMVLGSSASNCQSLIDALAADWAAWRGSEGAQSTPTFRFRLPGRVEQRLQNGRPRRFAWDVRTVRLGWSKVVMTYYAPDPRIYSELARSVDIQFNGAANVSLPNVGNAAAPVIWRANGAVTNPTATRAGGAAWTITSVIGAATWAEVRTDAKTVVKSDSSNLYGTFSGTFLEIPAGGTTVTATAPSGSSQLNALYRDTWI